MTAQKYPPLPQEVRDRLKPYRHKRDRQDGIFHDTMGVKATSIRVERGDVTEDMIEDPETEVKAVRGGVRAKKHTTKAHRVQSQLEKMKNRGDIDYEEWQAGEQFALDIELAGGTVRSSLRFDINGGDPELALLFNSPDAAARRVARAMEAVGPALWPIVIWVAVAGKPASDWVKDQKLSNQDGVGRAMLKQALRTMAMHYGIDTAPGHQ